MRSVESRLDAWLGAAVVAGLGIVAGQGFSRFTFGLLFPRMGAGLVGSTSTSSGLAALYAAAYLAGTALLIYVTRHVAPLPLLAAGVGVSSLGLVSLGVAHSLDTVRFGLSVAGLGAAFTYVPALSYVGAAVSQSQRRRATGLAGAGIGIGIVVARILSVVFNVERTTQGWRNVWLGEGVIALLVTALVVVYVRRSPPSVQDRGMPMAVTLQMPHWSSLGLAYLCFGFDYSVFSNLAVKAWELHGLSGSWASNALVFVAPAQVGGGFVALWFAHRAGSRRAALASFVVLALATGEVALPRGGVGLAVAAALALGLVGAGITAQFVLIVRRRLSTVVRDRDATTTVFGVMTLLYGIGGLLGLIAGARLSQGHGGLGSTFVVATAVALIGAGFARAGTHGLSAR